MSRSTSFRQAEPGTATANHTRPSPAARCSKGFAVASLERADYATIVELESRYEDLHLGLADCALVVPAGRHRTDRLMSFDERHFRTVSPLTGEAFTLLPADA